MATASTPFTEATYVGTSLTAISVPLTVDPFYLGTSQVNASANFVEAAQVLSWDWPIANPGKAISGYIYVPGGTPQVGATVKLIRQADNAVVATTTSDSLGHYSFPRDTQDPNAYYVLSYTAALTPQVHGLSDRNLAPA